MSNRRYHERSPRLIALCICIFGLTFFPYNLSAKKSAEPQRLEAATPISSLSLPPLSAEQRAQLDQVRADPPPEEIVRDSHYWVSNEHNHQLWHPFIQGLGGALVGVGTDQNYLLAGWARSSILILMDFDVEIPTIHEVYAYFFSISATPADFISRWSKQYGQDSADQLEAHFQPIAEKVAEAEAKEKGLSEAKRDQYIQRRAKRYVSHRVKIFQRTRGLLWRRLTKTRDKYRALKIGTFLDDQSQYDHIRSLWAGGRVLAIRGDLTADLTMLDIGDALRGMGEQLTVVYLSNAEQYFTLTPRYRRNLIELPWAATSYALRTMGWRSLGFLDEDEKYHYNVQSGENLVAWMKQSRTTKAGRMMFKGRVLKVDPGFSVMEKLPPEEKKAPEIAPAARTPR